MSRLRIVYIVSLVILGVLLALVVFRPMLSGEKFSTVSRQSIIKTEDEWIIQFDIFNREGEDVTYTINWSTGGEVYSQRVLIRNGKEFNCIRHFYPDTVKDGQVHLTIYKEGEDSPFEECTYYISFDEEETKD